MTTTEKNKPVETIRDGNIKVTIWKNPGEHGSFYTFDITRSYRDADGNYQDTRSLGERDILRVGALTNLAYAKVLALRGLEDAAHQTEAA